MFLRTQHVRIPNLYGIKITMSITDNQVIALWKQFIPLKNKYLQPANSDLISAEVYPKNYFKDFSPSNVFEKWALVATSQSVDLELFESLNIDGLYAVFLHKGLQRNGAKTYQYIYTDWIPNSEYEIDNRPHFAVMKEKYHPESEDSEEEIWIPIVKLIK